MIHSCILRACWDILRSLKAALRLCNSCWFSNLCTWRVWYGKRLASGWYHKYVSWGELRCQLRNVGLIRFLFCQRPLASVFQVWLETNLSSWWWWFKKFFEICSMQWRPIYLSYFRLQYLFWLSIFVLYG